MTNFTHLLDMERIKKCARRKEDIQHYNVTMMRAEQERQQADKLQAEKEQSDLKTEQLQIEIEKLRQQISAMQANQNQ